MTWTRVAFAGAETGMTGRQTAATFRVLAKLLAAGGTLLHGDGRGADAEAHDYVVSTLRGCRVVVFPPEGPDRAVCCGHGVSAMRPMPAAARHEAMIDACEVFVGARPPKNCRDEEEWAVLEYARERFKPHVLIDQMGKTYWMTGEDRDKYAAIAKELSGEA